MKKKFFSTILLWIALLCLMVSSARADALRVGKRYTGAEFPSSYLRLAFTYSLGGPHDEPGVGDSGYLYVEDRSLSTSGLSQFEASNRQISNIDFIYIVTDDGVDDDGNLMLKVNHKLSARDIRQGKVLYTKSGQDAFIVHSEDFGETGGTIQTQIMTEFNLTQDNTLSDSFIFSLRIEFGQIVAKRYHRPTSEYETVSLRKKRGQEFNRLYLIPNLLFGNPTSVNHLQLCYDSCDGQMWIQNL